MPGPFAFRSNQLAKAAASLFAAVVIVACRQEASKPVLSGVVDVATVAATIGETTLAMLYVPLSF